MLAREGEIPMSQAARKLSPTITSIAIPVAPQAPAAPPSARMATAGDLAHASPALALQEQLQARVALTANGKWSYRRTFAFLAITNGAFWITAAWLVFRFVF
jgi:hypothetical protein